MTMWWISGKTDKIQYAFENAAQFPGFYRVAVVFLKSRNWMKQKGFKGVGVGKVN